MCLAQFAVSYTYRAKPPKTAVFDTDGNSELKSTTQKIFNHDIFLPKNINLKAGFGHMYLRTQPLVLRIHTSKNKEGHEKYYSEMLLFSHWTNESKELPLDMDACILQFKKGRKKLKQIGS